MEPSIEFSGTAGIRDAQFNPSLESVLLGASTTFLAKRVREEEEEEEEVDLMDVSWSASKPTSVPRDTSGKGMQIGSRAILGRVRQVEHSH